MPVPKEKIQALRSEGLTYKQIAEKVGVSWQYAWQVCDHSRAPEDRRYWQRGRRASKPCIYPELRKWMDANRKTITQLAFDLGVAADTVRSYTTGKTDMPKSIVDKLLAISGLPYEVLFAREDHQ